jgi:hypothetical protein
VSEEPSTDAAPGPRGLRWLRWLRRTSLRVRVIAAAVVVAVVAAVVFAVMMPSSAPKPAYASLPAPCAVVSRAALARYLPNPTGTSSNIDVPVTAKAGSCKWSSQTGGEDRTVMLFLAVFSGPAPISYAQQSYDATLSGLACHRCPGVTASTQRVSGLGDQATSVLMTAGPEADLPTPDNGANLLVWSSNAEMALTYDATAAEIPQPPDAAELTWLISMAHDVLADLARPVVLVTAPVIPEPHYAGSRDPCRLISGTTLARYAPGATVSADDASSGSAKPSDMQISTCEWYSSSVFISLQLTTFPDASSADLFFSTSAPAYSRSTALTTVTGTRWLDDLGEEAEVIFRRSSSLGHGAEMLIWSGNIELDYSFNVTHGPAPTDSALLAADIALARDGLATLASPSAAAYPKGPVYTSPTYACTLIKAATLARYAPSATVYSDALPTAGVPQLSDCSWAASTGNLDLDVNMYPDADQALGGYEFDVQPAQLSQEGETISGTQSVKGLGDRATAVLITFLGSPEVDLYVLSGNAVIQVSFTDLASGPALSRAQLLAADIAMVRDVLADLPVKR